MAPRGAGGKRAKAAARGGAAGANRRKIRRWGNYFLPFRRKGVLLQKQNTKTKTMKDQVLKAMREAGKPVSAGDVTKMLNADRKEVDKAFDALKKEGAIVSPVRCKWEPAK